MSSPTPIVIVGAAGRMGRTILECAGDSEEPFLLMGAVEAVNHPLIGHDLRMLIPTAPEGVVITPEIPTNVPSGTVAIIFSLPEPTLEHLKWSSVTGNPAVIGTTGFTQDQLGWVAYAARKAPILLSPNTSVGVNVLCELVAAAAHLLGPGFDIEITEMHHRFKKDSPSGTARRLADVALAVRGGDYRKQVRNGREGMVGERTPQELGIHAIRGGDVVGDHTVIFAGLGERIELTHRASSRETFARGALRAAAWLRGRKAGLYEMKDVLGI